MKAPPKLLTVAECAELAGCSIWVMKRRLLALHREHGGVLRSFQKPGKPVRKWLVCPEALRLLDVDQATREDIETLRDRVQESERRVQGLRDSHQALRRRTERALSEHDRKLNALKVMQEAQARVLEAWDG